MHARDTEGLAVQVCLHAVRDCMQRGCGLQRRAGLPGAVHTGSACKGPHPTAEGGQGKTMCQKSKASMYLLAFCLLPGICSLWDFYSNSKSMAPSALHKAANRQATQGQGSAGVCVLAFHRSSALKSRARHGIWHQSLQHIQPSTEIMVLPWKASWAETVTPKQMQSQGVIESHTPRKSS